MKSEVSNDISYHVRASVSGNAYLYLAHPRALFLNTSKSTNFLINKVNMGEYGGKMAMAKTVSFISESSVRAKKSTLRFKMEKF